ncbi:unnamed protein product [Darwinula stevensoni]|uniref:Uncharacterized protein n=1 Tax=Darwinula stevensoni TaxID=69355 RepID=A0A7R9FTG7_9CRUS|nr:unnamed protein product [Darwinula stevensoni]CAG0905274.1 unnamed protein product [Darwinula stevensoni]
MEREEAEFLHRLHRRFVIGRIASVLATIAVSASLIAAAFQLLPLGVRDGEAIVAVVALIALLSFLVVWGRLCALYENQRRRRCLDRGFDPDAYFAPNVPSVYVEEHVKDKEERRRERFLLTDQYYTISRMRAKDSVHIPAGERRRVLVHPDVLEQILGKSALHRRPPRPGQPFVLLADPPRRFFEAAEALVVRVDLV